MSGVTFKLEGAVPAPESWAEEAEGFVHIIESHPEAATILFICFIIVLILMPGGVGPSWTKYRGSVRHQEQKRFEDVDKIVKGMSKRSRRRARGRQKGETKQ